MQNFEKQDDDFADIEEALMKMRPVDLSDRFYASVEAAMNEQPDNTVRLPHRGGRLNLLSFRRLAASVAMMAGVVGLGLWGYSVLPGNAVRPAPGIAAISESSAVMLSAGGGASLLGTNGHQKEPLLRKRRERGNYNLVNVERRMNTVAPIEVVASSDGSVSRRMRYVYMDEYRWENSETGSAFVELRPHEEVVCMEMPVY
ncbi:MAG: hypothetical protein IKM45_02005 [Opitutales bacterium]|nr:hypothetical protein [Opitutales bacterium]